MASTLPTPNAGPMKSPTGYFTKPRKIPTVTSRSTVATIPAAKKAMDMQGDGEGSRTGIRKQSTQN